MGDVNGDILVTITTGWNYGYTYNRILVNDEIIQSGVEQKTFSDIIVHPGDVIKLQTRQENQSSIVQSNVQNTITLSYNITQEENDYYHDKQILYWRNYESRIGSRTYSTVVPSQLFKYSNLAIFGENISNTSGDPDLRIDGTSIGKLGATIPYIGNITAGENHSIDIYNGWSSANTIKVSKFNIFTYKYKIPSIRKAPEDDDGLYILDSYGPFSNDTRNFRIPISGNYRIVYEISTSDSLTENVTIMVNGIQIAKTFGTYEGKMYSIDKKLSSGDVITIIQNDGGSIYPNEGRCTYRIYSEEIVTSISRILYPQKINTIGETTQVLIYGKLGDDYITDFDFNLVTSVQTGNITLGNAIGFIQLKYRGITYKIPVYG